jgi:hypothetical protein
MYVGIVQIVETHNVIGFGIEHSVVFVLQFKVVNALRTGKL